MNPKLSICIAGTAVAALLAGCGGGAGGDSTPPAASSVVLTTTNQDTVARAAANAALSSATAAAVTPASADGKQAAAIGVQGQANARSLTELLLGLAQQAVVGTDATKKAQQTTAVKPQAVATHTTNCAAGGTVTLTLDDRDNSGAASSGDVASLVFNQCRDSASEVVNGNLSATYTAAQSGPSSASASATITFSNLAATSSEGSFAINGTFSFNFSRQGTLKTAQFAVGASGLSAAITTPSYNDTITLGAGYTATLSRDENALAPGSTIPGADSLTVNGAITAASIGGTVVINTPVPFKQYDIDDFPREGQLQVRGANNGLLLLTAQSPTTARVMLDANGDGTFETTKDVPWSVLI